MSKLRNGTIALMLAIAVSSGPVFADRPESAGRPEGAGQSATAGRPDWAGPPSHAGQGDATDVEGEQETAVVEVQALILVECVEAHLAGRSGKGQIRGGGVHLVVESDTVEDVLSDEDLTAAATLLADATCEATEPLGEEALAELVADIEALEGVTISHLNTYDPLEEEEEETEDEE